MSAVDASCRHAARTISWLDVTRRHWIATCQRCGFVEWDDREYRGATTEQVLNVYEKGVECVALQRDITPDVAKEIAGAARRDMACIVNRVRATRALPEMWHLCIDPNDPNERYGTLSHHEAHDVEDSMLVIGGVMWVAAVQVACDVVDPD